MKNLEKRLEQGATDQETLITPQSLELLFGFLENVHPISLSDHCSSYQRAV